MSSDFARVLPFQRLTSACCRLRPAASYTGVEADLAAAFSTGAFFFEAVFLDAARVARATVALRGERAICRGG
ncbi:MAG: hypothetical protein AMXMBFR34_37290 [Myxococcaceae bacterium]